MSRNPILPRLKEAVATPATAFLLRASAWFVGLLGLLRLPWVQAKILLPYTMMQATVAEGVLGQPLRVFVATSCSGSDAIAVCLGAILAFPVLWRRRLLAAAGGLAVITVFNTVRIAHLSAVAEKPELQDLLHQRIWPAMIILVAAGYAFAWMRSVTQPRPAAKAAAPAGPSMKLPTWPVVTLAAVFVAAYYAFYDRLLASSILSAAAERTAWVAGGLMGFCGVSARVQGGVLQTPGSAWIVTPECVTTPLIPIALATLLVVRISWRQRLIALLVLPLAFQALAVARLMVLAVPQTLIRSPTIAVHAFYQLLLAVGLIVWLASRRREDRARSAVAALGLGALAGVAVGMFDLQALRPTFVRLAGGLHLGHGYVDQQGALVLLPAFQIGLLTALWATRSPLPSAKGLAIGSALIAAVSAATLVLLGELSVHAAIELPVVLVRAGSLAPPLLFAWAQGWTSPSRDHPVGSAESVALPAA